MTLRGVYGRKALAMSQNVIIWRITPQVEVLFDISLTLCGTMLQKHQRLMHWHRIGKHGERGKISATQTNKCTTQPRMQKKNKYIKVL